MPQDGRAVSFSAAFGQVHSHRHDSLSVAIEVSGRLRQLAVTLWRYLPGFGCPQISRIAMVYLILKRVIEHQ